MGIALVVTFYTYILYTVMLLSCCISFSTCDCTYYHATGCELTGSCSASAIGDHMCSVGSGLQCLCQHPRLMGDSDTCADGIYMIKINEPQLPWLRTAIYHTQA